MKMWKKRSSQKKKNKSQYLISRVSLLIFLDKIVYKKAMALGSRGDLNEDKVYFGAVDSKVFDLDSLKRF